MTQLKEKLHSEVFNPYNVKILRNFVLYFKDKLGWRKDELESLFNDCGVPLSYLDSDDNWFDQEFADKFYQTAVQRSGEVDLAFKVGAYTISQFSQGIGGLLLQSAVSVKLPFRNIQRMGGVYTKGSVYEATEVTNEKAIIRSRVSSWCKEKKYQCENRIGMLASMPVAFGCTKIETSHPLCFHRGDAFCEYEIRWKEPARYKPIPIAFVSGIISFAAAFLVTKNTIVALMLGGNLCLAVFCTLRELLFGNMKRILAEQNSALEDSVRVMGRRRDEQALLQGIIKATTQMMPIKELSKLSTELIKREMHYDRVIIALVDRSANTLKVTSSVGFETRHQEMLESSEFRIRAENSAGFFIKVVNSKKPLLEPDVQKVLHTLSPRSQAIVKELNSKAIIVVPITFKEEVLGILSVENVDEKKPLGKNDVDVLGSLASHLAVAVSNAASFDAKLKALEHAQEMEQRQRKIKEIFQKFVPTEIVDQEGELSENDLTFLSERELSVMFVDIINFTSLCEKLQTEDVANLLNIHIQIINEIVTGHGGRINKVIGDGLLIYFDPSKHRIISAAQAILEAVPELNQKLVAKGLPRISIGMGCHKGMCTIGSIGYSKRLDYTLIGDTVNTAARIESNTRQFGGNTICFSRTLLEEANSCNFISCGTLQLKGKKDPLEIFRLDSNSVKAAA